MDIFNKEKTVISCFDLTGNMARPWAEAGYAITEEQLRLRCQGNQK